MKQFVVKECDHLQRVDNYVLKMVPLLSRIQMYKTFKRKKIKVNSKKCKISTRLKTGDIVEMYIEDALFSNDDHMQFKKSLSKLDVMYEDKMILIINKPAGLIVYNEKLNNPDTLINRVLKYLYDRGEYNPVVKDCFKPSLCHRLDRNTSGLLVVAKTEKALHEMNRIFSEREIEKRYKCIVHGNPKSSVQLLKHYLTKDSKHNIVKVTTKPNRNSKTIITSYSVIDSIKGYSLLDVNLHTGRTHQIRAHMSFIGHPILGDNKYGYRIENDAVGYNRQTLCAYSIRFNIKDQSSILYYLNGRKYVIRNIDFVDEFNEFKQKSRNT